MSRVTLGASLLTVITCLSLPGKSIAQSDQGEPKPSAPGGGYGGEYGGRGGYGMATSEAESPFSFEGETRGGGSGRGSYVTVGSEAAATKATERIETTLNERLKAPLQYEDQPLNEIINTLQEEYDIPILFDIAALEEVAISPDTEVTINLRNITLRSALNLMLRQPGLEDLTFVIDEEVLLITTEEKANQKMTVEVYRVDDLVRDSRQLPSSGDNPYSSLVQVVTKSVQYDSWMVNGSGEGEALLMQPGVLVVTSTRCVHEQVQQLLEKLRAARAGIEEDYDYGRGGREGRGGGSF